MILSLFKWVNTSTPIPGWGLTIIAIVLWGVLSWLVMKMVMRWKIRPARVVILAQRVIFLAGAIFFFNVALAPVVLIAFHGMALYTLIICALAGLLYLIRVTDKEEPGMGMGIDYSTSYPKDDDVFG